MRWQSALVLAAFVLSPAIAGAQADLCGQVLRPTVESTASDLRSTYAYMASNAEYEYDLLKSMSSGQRAASATYKVFSGEYKDSTSRQDFSERVRNRIRTENVFSSSSEARTAYRENLSDNQVSAWLGCAVNGGILLHMREVTASGFVLRVTAKPGTNVPSIAVQLRGTNALIDGVAVKSWTFTGPSSKGFAISRPAGSTNPIVSVIVNGGGYTDDVTVNLSPTPPQPQLSFPIALSPAMLKDCKSRTDMCFSSAGYVVTPPANNSTSFAKFGIPKGSQWFTAALGKFSTEPGCGGSATASVWLDNVQVLSLHAGDKTLQPVRVPIPVGARELTLQTSADGTEWCDDPAWLSGMFDNK